MQLQITAKCVYDNTTIVQYKKWIMNNMRGLLPLYGSELKLYGEYATDQKINPELLMSMHSQITTQYEIYKSSTPIDKIYDMIEKWLDKPYSLNQFVANTKLSPSKIIKIITEKYIDRLDKSIRHDLEKLTELIKLKNKSTQQRSREFEIDLENYLTDNKISYITEQQLKNDKKYNCTPDILFIKPVDIVYQGKTYTIYWIDAKNYVLIDTPFLTDKLQKQADKYTKCFGFGAFIFKYGYDVSIELINVLILDGCDIKK